MRYSIIILVFLIFITCIFTSCVTSRISEKTNLSATLKSGKSVYNDYCFVCHGESGEGSIGPNLTDNYWLHGNALDNIVSVVENGLAEKGMPKWNLILTEEQISDLALYVQSLHGTNPKDQKGPEGIQY